MTDVQTVYLIWNSVRLVLVAVLFILIFSHVWTRKGYEGKDGVLDLQEVDKFVTHIISVVCYVALDSMQIWEAILGTTISTEWMIVFAGGFLGSGIYIVFGGLLKKKLVDAKASEQNP